MRDHRQRFWDTLRRQGVQRNALRLAATAAGLTFDQHVDAQQLAPFIEALNGRGQSFALHLVTFDLRRLVPLDSVRIGNGETALYIGLFIGPEGNVGHYVPALD
jgi:hypothetical protein